MTMKQNRRRRTIAVLLTAALMLGLLPLGGTAAQAAAGTVLPQEALHPAGITVNLFDYWVTSQTASDNGKTSDADLARGINQGHALKFVKENGSGDPTAPDFDINKWTRSARPKTGIVAPRLGDDGYPVLDYVTPTETGDGGSLRYLFSGEDGNGKQAYINTGGLLRQDAQGYYRYDCRENFAAFNAGKDQFTLYDGPAVKAAGASSSNGQFFPFNSWDQVQGIDSVNPVLNHYFGVHMKTQFQQPAEGCNNGEPVTFDFTGDDDVWVFIDGVLAADLGGIHNATSVTIDFESGAVVVYGDNDQNGHFNSGDSVFDQHTLKEAYAAAAADTTGFDGETYADNSYHTLDFFYLERGNTDSNMEMKFNLATIPGSALRKTDQDGQPVEGADFALYATGEDYEVAADAQPIAEGTTDASGSFVFYRADGTLLSLGTLKEGCYVLREKETPPGYRSNGDIHLWLEAESGVSGLLLSQNEWDTGAYAMAKARVSTGRIVEDVEGQHHSVDDGVVFAAVFKGKDAGKGPAGFADCQVVYGDPVNGWQLSKATGKDGLREAAAAMLADPEMKGLYRFREGKLNASDNVNNFYTILDDLPGDITRYYWIDAQGLGDDERPVDYTIAFFYLDDKALAASASAATAIAAAPAADIALLTSDTFTRDFAVSLYAPNISNRLLVQKVDAEDEKPLDGAVFALYGAQDMAAQADGRLAPVPQAEPFRVTAPTGAFMLGTQRIEGVAALEKLTPGHYYLVEQLPPEGYSAAAAPVEVVVDAHGVHANAGSADDDVAVTLGVGKIVKSMVQFAADDQIDATLHDVRAELQTADAYEGTATDWQPAGEAPLTLSYLPAAYGPLEYGDADADKTDPEAFRAAMTRSYDSGWGRLAITQDRQAQTPNTYKQDLGDQPLNACFSGTTMVTVGDAAELTEQPGDPDQPSDDPEPPDHPETPNDPDQPSDKPDEPDAPDQPNEPEQPDAPDQPADDPEQPPLDPDGPDDLNTTDHFYYIVGYPEDYRTGVESWDESRWPVKPQGAITRAEVATMFYRLLKKDVRAENETADNAFHDVNADDWFNVPVSTLSRMGIIGGYPSGDFQPNAPISRAEFAAVATRFFENTDIAYEEGLFSDIRGDEWFAKNFAAAFQLGLIGGYPDGSVRPARTITRAEACAIVNRTLQRVPEKDHLRPTSEMRTWPDNSDTNAWYYADMQEATNGHDYEWRTANKKRIENWTRIRPDFNWDAV